MPGHTVREIASALGGTLHGDGDILIAAASEPQSAEPGQLAIAMDARYAARITDGRARAALLRDGADWRGLGLQAAITVTRPRLAMAQLTETLLPASPMDEGIHPTAIVHASSEIAEGAAIGAYSVIEAGVKIGARAQIGCHVTVGQETRIGDDCQIQPGVRIGRNVRIGNRFLAHSGVVLGGDGFSFVTMEKSAVEGVKENLSSPDVGDPAPEWLKIHSLGGVLIGSDVEIGANSSVDAGTIRPTVIGDGTKLDALVQVGHNVVVGRHCLLCAHVAVGGSARLGDGVVLGGQAGVADNIHVGDGVIAGGASKILSNVPKGRAILGYPATKMDTQIENYKLLRRLPRLLEALKKQEK